jgi:hypothetical protein
VEPFLDMPLKYQTGQQIIKGDRVLFHLKPAVIELVATDPNDPAQRCYVEDDGGGVLVREPGDDNLTFIPTDQLDDYEDLEFVGRADAK